MVFGTLLLFFKEVCALGEISLLTTFLTLEEQSSQVSKSVEHGERELCYTCCLNLSFCKPYYAASLK